MDIEVKISDLSKINEAGRLLDELVKKGKIGPIYERKEYVDICLNYIKSHRNVLLIGDHGVGKNALVEYLAKRIVMFCDENSPLYDSNFPYKHIVETNAAKLYEGCFYAGNLENKIINFLKNCENEKAIIFFDNLHLSIGIGSSSSNPNDTIAIITNLMNKDTRLIGTTTPEGYKILQKIHSKFIDQFVPLEIPPTNIEQTEAILMSLKKEYEKIYNVQIEDDVLSEIVRLSNNFQHWKKFPGKAIELFLNLINLNSNCEILNKKILYEYFIKETGLPQFLVEKNSKIDREEIKQFFSENIFGQDEAIDEVINIILKFKTGLNKLNKPIGSFIFLGLSGTGKTELAKLLAKYIFGYEERLLIYPMSQYRDHEGYRKLFGGEEFNLIEKISNAGKLINDIKISPFSVILLDEIDQASREVIDGLYQILDEGRYIKNNGDVIYFGSTIIIMTTNLGMENFYSSSIGFKYDESEKRKLIYDKIKDELENYFGQPFLNRIDKIIIFNPLTFENMKKIVIKTINNHERTLPGLKERNLNIEVNEDVLDFLAKNGYDEKYGARKVHRVIDQYIIEPISYYLADNPEIRDKTFFFTLKNGNKISCTPS